MTHVYSVFKNDLLDKARDFTHEDLRNLISEYETVINSKRRSSCIKSCDDLITLLEKRAHVSADNYLQLENIVLRLRNEREKKEMLVRLNQSTRIAEVACGLTYATVNGSPSAQSGFSSRLGHSNRSVNGCHLPEEVVALIAEEIGNKWRPLGRGLEVREGDLDIIEEQHRRDWKACASKVLQHYLSKCKSQQRMEEKLLSALSKARRNDLRDSVENMLRDC